MRIRLVIKDTEYCRALADAISQANKDAYIEIGARTDSAPSEKTIVITDIDPEIFGSEVLEKGSRGIVFLTDDPGDGFNHEDEKTSQRLFKYSSISRLLGDIEMIDYLWNGETDSSYGMMNRIWAVCSDRSDDSSIYTRALARQLLYRIGGRIMVLSLKYINSYALADESDPSCFSRLLYYMSIGKDYPVEAFSYTDSYGINYLRIPVGINPPAYMNSVELDGLIRGLCYRKFDTIILDIGDAFSPVNNSLISRADNILWFTYGSGLIHKQDVIPEEETQERVAEISINTDTDVELVIDDYIRKIYEIEENTESGEKKNN